MLEMKIIQHTHTNFAIMLDISYMKPPYAATYKSCSIHNIDFEYTHTVQGMQVEI